MDLGNSEDFRKFRLADPLLGILSGGRVHLTKAPGTICWPSLAYCLGAT